MLPPLGTTAPPTPSGKTFPNLSILRDYNKQRFIPAGITLLKLLVYFFIVHCSETQCLRSAWNRIGN